jgi:hypothetical protein
MMMRWQKRWGRHLPHTQVGSACVCKLRFRVHGYDEVGEVMGQAATTHPGKQCMCLQSCDVQSVHANTLGFS